MNRKEVTPLTKRIAIFIITATVSLIAQPPGEPGPRPGPGIDAIKAHLGLTDSQIQSIQQTGRQRDLAHQSANEQIQQKQTTLHDLLQKGTSDAATVGKLMLEMEALRKSIGQIDVTFRDQARNALTADQKTKLKALDDGAALMPAIQQAIGLHLVTPPSPPPGGPGFGPGPGGRGQGDRFRIQGGMPMRGGPPPPPRP